jgi:DNA-binding transcriptional ArsR family regulator
MDSNTGPGLVSDMPAKVRWENVVSSVASTAIESAFQTPHGRRILRTLVESSESGLSFKELRERLGLAASSLDNALTDLLQGAVVENRLERREGSKDFSFYRATELGRVVQSEIDAMFLITRRRIIEHSHVPELSHLALTAVAPDRLYIQRAISLRNASMVTFREVIRHHSPPHSEKLVWNTVYNHLAYASKYSTTNTLAKQSA